MVHGAGVTHLTLPPTVLRHLDALHAPECTVISAGELLDSALAGQLRARCGRLINAYGPCEATIGATAHDVVETDDSVPIGTALKGVAVELEAAPELPAGAHPDAGIIAIAGPTVAWGYVIGDRLAPAATPGFSTDGRYVTGDLAWRDDSDALVFAGRIDRQVKRWGHRVEPGAIESRLRTLPRVRDCAVVPEGGRLHAFVVTDGTSQELAEAAPELLLRHEQPTDWHIVDTLPALASDKANVAALKELVAHAAPAPAVDPRLAALWEQFIGPIEDPDTDIFGAGGDSMGTILLLAAVQENCGVTVNIEEFLKQPTLGALAERVALGARS
jgi:acyl-coenzyme A synthetase/AMP-(fatty) acid ligase/acyl carrier protein